MPANDAPPPTLASLRLRKKSPPPPRDRTGGHPQHLLFADPDRAPAPVLRPESTLPPFAPELVEHRPRPTPAEPHIYTVRALVLDIRNAVESGYTDISVEGEISNLRPAGSGHLYFTLKDGEAQLPVVLFRRQAALLRFRPKDGDEIRARGRVSIYESRGQLQLIAETLELRGTGALQLAFERLKARLLAEGLFDPARKRPLPAFPRCIGVVTSTAGAVIRDIVTVARRRHGRLNLLIYPAAMQGPQCPPSVAGGIRWFNLHPERVDLILIARGGGSFEDLNGFNDESLARAIAASHLPVVSAIGHETDFTIADFAADLRAPTPSAAAEIITAAQHRIEERLAALETRASRAIRFHLLHACQRLARLSAESVLRRLHDAVSRRDQRLDDLRQRVHAAEDRCLRALHHRLALLESRLRRQDIHHRLAVAARRLASAETCLHRAAAALFAARTSRLAHAHARLQALSPLAVLNRGYALVYSSHGLLLADARDTAPGRPIRARLARGSLTATITEITPA